MEIEGSNNQNRQLSLNLPASHLNGQGVGTMFRAANGDTDMYDNESSYEETKTNPSGFFHDTKSAVSIIHTHSYVFLIGRLLGKSGSQSQAPGQPRAIRVP